jgi:hypothetical protein
MSLTTLARPALRERPVALLVKVKCPGLIVRRGAAQAELRS